MMKWFLMKETFSNLSKTFISSFSFFPSCLILMSGFHRKNTCFFYKNTRFFCTNQQNSRLKLCVAPNFQLNFQRIFFPQSANYSLKFSTNEVVGIPKMRFRLQNNKYIWADFQPGLLIELFIYSILKVGPPHALLRWGGKIFQKVATPWSFEAT